MRRGQRGKLTAGVGLVAMLLGALMVIAPTGVGAEVWTGADGQPALDGGGNVLCSSLDPEFTVSAKDETSGGATSGTIDGNGFKADWRLLTGDDLQDESDNRIEVVLDETSRPAHAVIIKTGNAGNPSSNGLLVYERYTPVLMEGTRYTDYPGSAVSNIRLCGVDDQSEEKPTLRVEKDVVGSAGDASFAIDVTLLGESDEFVADNAQIADTEMGFWEREGAGTFNISEVVTGGADSTTWACYAGASTEAFMSSEGASTDITGVEVEQSDVTCVFTNTFDAPPPNIPQTESITVIKEVQGGTLVPEDWSAAFTTVGSGLSDFSLGPDGVGDLSATTGVMTLQQGTYEITEVLPELGDGLNVSLSTLSCDEGDSVYDGFTRDGDTAIIELGDGDNVVCTFSNTFTQVADEEVEPGSIEIVKAVDGPVPEDGWSFGFNGDLGSFDLTNDDPSEDFGPLEPGDYRITEGDSDGVTLGSIDCGEADVFVSGRSVLVSLDEGDDVSCVFTNVFPEVESETTEPTTPEPEVKGETTIRALPRTGSGTGTLAGFGAALIGLGAALVLGSRRRGEAVA